MANPNFPNNPGYNLYKGARYVPKFSDVNEGQWTNTVGYEPLTIVLHEGNSYTSKQFVPVGVDIANTTYWALTGNFNGQIVSLQNTINGLLPLKNTALNWINVVAKGADNTGESDCGALLNTLISANTVLYFPAGTYMIEERVKLLNGCVMIGDNATITSPTLNTREAVTITGNDTAIIGFNFNTNRRCVGIYSSSNVFVDKCSFTTMATTAGNYQYAVDIYDSSYIVLTNLHINQPNERTNNADGIHINGNNHDIVIDNVYGVSGDDFIALNCPEGTSGDIYNVTMSHIVNTGTYLGIRLYSTGQKLSNIVIRDSVLDCLNTGSAAIRFTNSALSSGSSTSANAEISNVLISNCVLNGNSNAWFGAVNGDNITFENCDFNVNSNKQPLLFSINSHLGKLLLKNCQFHYYIASIGYTATTDTGVVIDHLVFDGCVFDFETPSSGLLYSRGTITRLTVVNSEFNYTFNNSGTYSIVEFYNNKCNMNSVVLFAVTSPCVVIVTGNNLSLGAANVLSSWNNATAVLMSANLISKSLIESGSGASAPSRLNGLDCISRYYPESPITGDTFYYRSGTTITLKYYNGTEWV